MTRNLTKKQATRRAWGLANREKIRESGRAWRRVNQEKIREKRAAYRLANREALRTWQKEYHRRNKEKTRAYWLRTQYGLDHKQFQKLLIGQKNRCGICKEKFQRTPHIDHSHAGGKVRGLLCAHCNQGLGHFKDSKKILKNAIKHLCEKHC